MSDKEQDGLIPYYIEITDKRLERIEEKVDKLLAFKWQIISGSLVLSTLAGIALQIVLAFMGK